MPEPHLGLLITIFIFAIAFAFTNGINDAANAIAASVGSRVLSPRAAVAVAALGNFTGAATGTAVAKTIGKGIVGTDDLTLVILVAALASIVIWGLLATRYGFPISLTHGLVAGLVGAGIAKAGVSAIHWYTFGKVFSAVIIAPILGFVGGFFIMILFAWIFRNSMPATMRSVFGNLQILTAAFLSYSHGKNDGQMPIGVITAGLVFYNADRWSWDHIEWWVIVLSASAITLGTALGGWRVIQTLGTKVTALRPVHGFAAQGSAAAVIETASNLAIPVSTTHCASSAIMGVGASRRFSAVRWGVARDIVIAWIVTFPICGVLGWILAHLFGAIF